MWGFKTFGVALFALATALSAPAFAQDDESPDAPAIVQSGQFYWKDVDADGPISIVVSVSQQLAYVYRGDTVIGVSSVSTGKPGHETPTGSFTILQKEADHHSNLYDDASMPFMERLTWDGVALHAGRVVNRPASHGCVRLPLAFAKRLYGVTDVGAAVTITDDDIAPETQPMAVGDVDTAGADQ